MGWPCNRSESKEMASGGQPGPEAVQELQSVQPSSATAPISNATEDKEIVALAGKPSQGTTHAP